jgi:formate hydrogenlyase subunit 6/NADH:ubiquinone oxidoreductase subunit I
LIGDGRAVVAPVEEEGVLLFRSIKSADRAVLPPSGKTRWSPKEYFFPRSETLYTYTVDGSSIRLSDPPKEETRQVLIGVRPCDAAGFAILDDTFLGDIPDSIYGHRRERTTIISAACTAAGPECFCTAVDGSPVGTVGSDVQIVPLDNGWLLRSLTEKGAELIGSASGEWEQAAAKELKEIEKLGARVAQQIDRGAIQREWGELLERGFDHPAWEKAAEHCLSCSTCSYVCPSCSCFDMNHEGSAWCGSQCRSWDACTYAVFTLHASGHNPRSTPSDRYRQRVLHKFAFTDKDREGSFRCVGCGRCVALCPAGVDIAEEVRTLVRAMQEESQDECR